jgi:hypothetical protein
MSARGETPPPPVWVASAAHYSVGLEGEKRHASPIPDSSTLQYVKTECSLLIIISLHPSTSSVIFSYPFFFFFLSLLLLLLLLHHHLHLLAFFHCLLIILGSRDSSVGIVTGYGLDDREARNLSPGRVKNFLSST